MSGGYYKDATIIVNGHPTHIMHTLIPPEDQTARYAQLYIIDSWETRDIERMKIPANENIDIKIVRIIIEGMEKLKNKFIKTFQRIGEVLKAYKAENKDLSTISVVFNKEFQQKEVHPGRQNLPTADDELAMVFLDETGGDCPSIHRSLQVYAIADIDKQRKYDDTFLSILNPCLQPMCYPLLYPDGQLQWHPKWKCDPYEGVENPNPEKGFTLLQYTSAMIQVRKKVWRPHIYSGRLFQQYLLDMALSVESLNLDWIRFNQDKLKVEQYVWLQKHLERKALQMGAAPKFVLLPSTHGGSPREMRQQCLDALAIVRDKGGPDIFITFTANPDWPEVKEELGEQNIADRPDILNRVFYQKFQVSYSLIDFQTFLSNFLLIESRK